MASLESIAEGKEQDVGETTQQDLSDTTPTSRYPSGPEAVPTSTLQVWRPVITHQGHLDTATGECIAGAAIYPAVGSQSQEFGDDPDLYDMEREKKRAGTNRTTPQQRILGLRPIIFWTVVIGLGVFLVAGIITGAVAGASVGKSSSTVTMTQVPTTSTAISSHATAATTMPLPANTATIISGTSSPSIGPLSSTLTSSIATYYTTRPSKDNGATTASTRPPTTPSTGSDDRGKIESERQRIELERERNRKEDEARSSRPNNTV
ncbi:hypothetical protein QBC44DRAFT_371814 [Cladorrhinum sp. PSN332]|nr:hypothetical protein QBC44DRAFT_371814 [Cladorrhinum sp. PSN332]